MRSVRVARTPRNLIATILAIIMAVAILVGVERPSAAAGESQQVIVELEAPAMLQVRDAAAMSEQELTDARSTVAATQDSVLDAAEAAGLSVEPNLRYESVVNGFSATVPTTELSELEALSGIAAVHANETFTADLTDSVELVGADEVWDRDDDHGEPVTGTDQIVAILDTGIDYNHPALGEGFGDGYRVIGGYDFVNDDDDPFDDHGHGTHVAGIVGADGDDLTGVAPGASLTAYKVLDGGGEGTTEQIAAGIDAAADPASPYQADVINLSLGGPGDGTDIIGQAATAATEAGIMVVSSAGNSGPSPSTISSPASAEGVLAVAATTSGLHIPHVRVTDPDVSDITTTRDAFSANPPLEPSNHDLVHLPLDEDPSDYDVDGRAVLAAREARDAESADLAIQLEAQGAAAVMQYDPAAVEAAYTDPAGTIGTNTYDTPAVGPDFTTHRGGRLEEAIAVTVDPADAALLLGLLEDGDVTVELSAVDGDDQVAAFSSRGPGPQLDSKPELAAPGVDILSTMRLGDWDPEYRMSGTSMAAPHVAGAAALLGQLNPDWSQGTTRDALIGSATGIDAEPHMAGAGRLQVDAAADAVVVADGGALNLGLADTSTSTATGETTGTLRNLTEQDVTLDLDVAVNRGVAAVTPSELNLSGGDTDTFTLSVSDDAPRDHTIVEGVVTATAATGEATRLPFQMPVRYLQVHASPDPAYGRSEVFVFTHGDVVEPPAVSLTGPNGESRTVELTHSHDYWWRGEVEDPEVGTWQIDATAEMVDDLGGATVTGSSGFVSLDPGGAQDVWESAGPNSESGGMVTAPDDSGNLSVWSSHLGLGFHTSEDLGAHWERVSRLPRAGGSGQLQLDPSTPDRWYYPAWGGDHDPSYVSTVLRSDDGADSWQELTLPAQPLEAFTVADDGTVAVQAGGLLYLSTDQGETWSSRGAPWDEPADELVFSGSDLLVRTSTEVWRVADVADPAAGAELVFEPESSTLRDLVAEDGLVLVNTYNHGVYASTDDGATFDFFFDPRDHGGARAQSVSMAAGRIFAPTLSSVWISDDEGATWTEWENPDPGLVYEAGTWPGAEESVVSSHGAGVYSTTDGDAYDRIGVPGAPVHALAVAEDDDDPRLLAGTTYGVYGTPVPPETITAAEREWGPAQERMVGVSSPHVQVSPEDPSVVYRLRPTPLSEYVVERSDDAGRTWELLHWVNEAPHALMIHPDDPDRIVVTFWSLLGNGLETTADGGETWERIMHDELIVSLAADPDDPDAFWAGSANGLWHSDDFGQTLTQVDDWPVTSILLDPRSPERLITGGETIRVSNDGGESFEPVDHGGLPLEVGDITASPADPDEIVVSGRSFAAGGLLSGGRGVLRSTDGADTFTQVALGIDDPSVTSLTYDPTGEWLFAGTTSAGVMRASVADLPTGEPELESVALEPAEPTVEVGDAVELAATALYDDGTSDDITTDAEWDSDDERVAVVDTGVVSGVAEGETEVTATFDGESASAQVTVTDDDDSELPPGEVIDLQVAPATAEVAVGETEQLTATAVFDDDSTVDVTDQADWASADNDIATVDAGVVTGVAEGDTDVTATFEDESGSAAVNVTDEDDDEEPEPGPEGLERISAEPGRVEVAIAASQHRFGDGEASAVVLARADEYPDALAGTTLAAEHGAPLLLTSSDVLLDNVADEIARVLGDDGQVFLAGGTIALDETVEQSVDGLEYDSTRFGGTTRFETAGVIADALGERSQVLVTTGLDFPDALTAGAAAAAHDGVVLLSADDDAHEVVDEYLDGFEGDTWAVGGPATRAYPDAQAVMGETRDETAVAVAEAFFDEPVAFGVSRRDDYPDALSGGAHIAAYEGPLLLSYTEDVPEETAGWLQATEATGGFVYGGTAAIDQGTFDQIEDLADFDNNDDDDNNSDGE